MAAAASGSGLPTQDLPRSKETSQPPAEESEEELKEETNTDGQAVSQKELEPTKGEANEQKEEGEEEEEETSAPPLPDEEAPPLPDEPVPGQEDDGWDALWDDSSQAYYFYNRLTGLSQWENPRIPTDQPGSNNGDSENGTTVNQPPPRAASGYDPTIHGDYDPTAWYAQTQAENAATTDPSADPNLIYTATGTFNRFTGKWQAEGLGPENFNPENRAKRQMNAFFDVDAAANSHDGKSLKAERSQKKLTKSELKAFKEKRRERKEEKRRAWLRD